MGKVVQPLQSVKSIRIAASAVMDMLAKPLQVRSLFLVLKMISTDDFRMVSPYDKIGWLAM